MMTDPDAIEYISSSEAAAFLHVTRKTVNQLVQRGEITGHKKTLTLRSPYLIEKASVLDYDRRRRAQSGAGR